MLLTRKYFIGSLVFHVVLVLGLFVFGDGGKKTKDCFLALGAYSSKSSEVLFKFPKIRCEQKTGGGRTSSGAGLSGGKKSTQPVNKRAVASGKKIVPVKKAINNSKVAAKNIVAGKSVAAAKTTAPVKSIAKNVATKTGKKHSGAGIVDQVAGGKKLKARKQSDTKNSVPSASKKDSKKMAVAQKTVQPVVQPAVEEKKIEQAPVADQSVVSANNDAAQDIVEQVDDEEDDEVVNDQDIAHDDSLPASDGQQMDGAVYMRHIQREVIRLWRPPLGVDKGTRCSVMFHVGSDGNVQDFKILVPSNVLIYDLSIVRVAKKFKFDRSLWGRKFKVDFRQ